MSTINPSIKIGFAGFGEVNSPKELIDAKCLEAQDALKLLGLELVTTPTVTDDPEGKDVRRALCDLQKEDFAALVVCLAGWIPSHAVISITDAFRHKPIILWGLCGDGNNGHVVTPAAQAGTTALRKVFHDLDYNFIYCYNIIGKPFPTDKISSFLKASQAMKDLRNKKIAMFGYRDMKLYNTLYEGLSLKQKLGIEVDFFEMLEVNQLARETDPDEVERVLNYMRSTWDFQKQVDEPFLVKGIRYYLAFKKLCQGYDAVSIKDVDGVKKLMNFPPAIIFMLLSDIDGICTIPENDVMGAVTQLVIRQLTDQSAAYLEFYEFFENSVLMGVPDYVPAAIVDGRVMVTQAAFGNISGGLLNISKIKTGYVTLARLSNTGDQYAMHIASGVARQRSWEEAGWDQPAPQLPSLEIFLETPVEHFAQQVSGQHYIISYGNNRKLLQDFCQLADIKLIKYGK